MTRWWFLVAMAAACAEGSVGTEGAGRDGSRMEDAGGMLPDGGKRTRPSDAGDTVETVARDCPEGAPQPVNRVRIVPVPGKAAELAGARIQGSNSGPTNDFVDLATIGTAPVDGAPVELTFKNERLYRYVKIYSAERSAVSVAELALYRNDRRLAGAPFGTPGGFEQAFDDDPSTAFAGSLPSGNYVGLDIGKDAVVAAPAPTPAGGALAQATSVTLASVTPGATIRYTLDGKTPSTTAGTVYRAPIALGDGVTTIKAIASADCLFDSEVVSARFAVGAEAAAAATRGFKTYHIGNSLTDTINPWLKPIADSTGVEHTYARWTSPGAPVAALWENPGMGFGTPEEASRMATFAPMFAPIDHMSVQPFADPSLDTQAEAAVKMFDTVRRSSPDVQFWVYAQWPARDDYRADSLVSGAGWSRPPWNVPAPSSWEDALQNQARFHEAFRAYVDEHAPGKPVRIVPAGLALLALKRAVEQGRVPGVRAFFDEHFSDDLHLSTKGQYLVALVFYSCLYGRSPVGEVTFEGTGLSAAQARIYQQIGWDTAVAYPWSGLSP